MPSWKKVIVSGSQAHLQGITASNLTNTTTGQIVGYSPTTGILSYFNTSSIVVATASYALTASFINPTGSNAFVQNGNSFGATAVLGTNDNQDLQFETNGSVRMTISSSGNIGIGTALPTAKLHISGASVDSLLRVGSPTNSDIFFVNGNGRVGIGTSTPTNTLQVSGSLWATTITASNIPSASNANFLLYNSQSGEFTYLSTSSIGGNVQGTGAPTQITYWTGTNTIAGDSGLTYDAGTDSVTVTGDIAVNGGDITTTSGTATIFNSNATILNIGSAATNVNIGAGSGTTNIKNNLVVAGDLTVNGDTTIINTSTLSVEDKFIVLGRSSGSQIPASEGGIIVEGAGGSGSAFVFNSGSGTDVSNRWGIATNVPTGSTNVTPTDFMVSVSQSSAAPSTAPTYGGSAGGFGNMYIQSDGEIWIYS